MPTINVAGYLGADGLRYDLESEDSPYASTIDKLQRMQYLEFASKVQLARPFAWAHRIASTLGPNASQMTPARKRGYNDARVTSRGPGPSIYKGVIHGLRTRTGRRRTNVAVAI